jgi:hypothetical protein
MRKIPFAEWFLSQDIGPERAAAILGDLTEMAATRGRLWFWTAYARSVVSLGWRTPVAILAAVVSVKYLRRRALHLLLYVIGFNHSPLVVAGRYSHLAVFSWIVSCSATSFLWIVFPYVAFRFGVRNRLTYLAGTLFLLSLPVYTFRPQVYQLTGLACALVAVAALASPPWRRQMIFLAANYPVAILVYYVCYYGTVIFRHGPFPVSVFGMRIDDPVAIAITVLIGPPLYRWLLQPRLTGGTHAELA